MEDRALLAEIDTVYYLNSKLKLLRIFCEIGITYWQSQSNTLPHYIAETLREFPTA
jgi:hypothetical protein